MTNEMSKALLMVALILAIEVTLHIPDIQHLWYRVTRVMPRRVPAVTRKFR